MPSSRSRVIVALIVILASLMCSHMAWAQAFPAASAGLFALNSWLAIGACGGLILGAMIGHFTTTPTGINLTLYGAAGGLVGGLVGGGAGGFLGGAVGAYTGRAAVELAGLFGTIFGGLLGGTVSCRYFKDVSTFIKDVEEGRVNPPPVEYTDKELEEWPQLPSPGPPPRPGI